jgi:hypothetical protein
MPGRLSLRLETSIRDSLQQSPPPENKLCISFMELNRIRIELAQGVLSGKRVGTQYTTFPRDISCALIYNTGSRKLWYQMWTCSNSAYKCSHWLRESKECYLMGCNAVKSYSCYCLHLQDQIVSQARIRRQRSGLLFGMIFNPDEIWSTLARQCRMINEFFFLLFILPIYNLLGSISI